MTKLADFKEFVKNNPNLLNYVKKGEMSWQKFYEMYDLYGEDNEIWDSYKKIEKKEKVTNMGDALGFLKTIDLDGLQEGISSIQRVIGVLGDLNKPQDKPVYKPRPLYKHFDD